MALRIIVWKEYMKQTLFGWFTTAPHPWKRAHRHGFDQGQVGWKLHAAPMVHDREDYDEGFRPQALCGLSPRHGWGLDMFIEDECSRCQAVMEKREAAGEVFVDALEKRRKEREAAECEAFKRERETEPPYPWPFNREESSGADAANDL